MKIEKMRWYKIIIDGRERIVRVDDQVMKYCVVDYYDSRLWFIYILDMIRMGVIIND